MEAKTNNKLEDKAGPLPVRRSWFNPWLLLFPVWTSEQMQKHFKIDSLENFGKHYLFIALLTSIYGTLAMFVIIHLL